MVEHFYQRARKYLEIDELVGRGQFAVSLAHTQATTFLAAHEMRNMYFPRAFLSIAKAARLCHMMNIHRMDGSQVEARTMVPAAKTWSETEERRRVFWAVFFQDRYQSMGSGWPNIMDEQDVCCDCTEQKRR
jgi:hypothetical protein